MSLWFRLLEKLESTLNRTHIGPLDEAHVEMRAWPTDLDWTGHVGDERYLEMMKLGRHCLASRMGVLAEMQKRGITAHVAATEVQYLSELEVFECFEMVSRVVGWDDKWLFVEQRFLRCGGRPLAVGLVQLVFKQENETVPPEVVMSYSGQTLAPPPLPAEVDRMRRNRPPNPRRNFIRFDEDDLPGFGSASVLAHP